MECDNSKTDNSKSKDFFLDNEVGNSWRQCIENTFETLILEHLPHGENKSYWYKALGFDKADASRIRRGLIIPKLWQRIKIADFFKTQSEVIWRNIPSISSKDEKQQKSSGSNGVIVGRETAQRFNGREGISNTLHTGGSVGSNTEAPEEARETTGSSNHKDNMEDYNDN